MGARFYSSLTGRVITRDTYRGNIYQPWTQNFYTYCNNNPINYVDLTGHVAMKLRDAVEQAGGKVSWDDESGVATATEDGNS